MRAKGYFLYPGKLAVLETFRVGCIGAIGAEAMLEAMQAIASTIREMGLVQLAPSTPAGV